MSDPTSTLLEHLHVAFDNLAEARRVNADGELLEPWHTHRCMVAAREELGKALEIFIAADLGTPAAGREPLPGGARRE